jgi:hypothetical protein
MPINTPRQDYLAAAAQWFRIRTLKAGSDAVKAAGVRLLPKPPAMSRENFAVYLDRACFFNTLAPSIAGSAGAVFQKEPTVTVPDRIAPYMRDITLANENLEQFALRTLCEVLTTGRAFALVNMSDGDPARPYVRLYAAEDVINWRVESRGGDETLTRVVIRECVAAPDPNDEFVDLVTEQYRALSLNASGEYQSVVFTRPPASRLTDREKWIASDPIVPQRRGAPLDFIPGVFINASSLTPTIDRPPLLDLADASRSYFMSSAELENLLWNVGQPVRWASSFQAGDGGKTLKVGSNIVWILGEHGSAGVLEMSGQGAGAIRTNMEDKKRQMVILGARLLEDAPRSQETATAVAQRNAASQATLKTIAQTVEAGLSMALQWLAWWVGPEAKPSDVLASIELSKDFYALRLSATELQALVTAWQSDGLSFDTLHYNLQRGDLMRPNTTADEERAAIARQAEPRPLTGA